MDPCGICLEPLVGDRAVFECTNCKENFTHLTCSKTALKCDRVEKRLPLLCPFCRIKFGADNLASLLPLRRELSLRCIMQPMDEQSNFKVFVAESFLNRTLIPEDPFQPDPAASYSSKIILAGDFNAVDLRNVPEVSATPLSDQRIIPRTPAPPTTSEPIRGDTTESPIRDILRKRALAEKALVDLGTAMRDLQPQRMETRRSKSKVDKISKKLATIRKLHRNLDSDILDLMVG